MRFIAQAVFKQFLFICHKYIVHRGNDDNKYYLLHRGIRFYEKDCITDVYIFERIIINIIK